MGRLLELAKGVAQSLNTLQYETNERNEKTPLLAPVSDTYHELCRDALRRICEHEFLPGAIRWAERDAPALYQRATAELPQKIHDYWTARVPLEDFKRLLDEWVEAHAALCSAYRTWSSSGKVQG